MEQLHGMLFNVNIYGSYMLLETVHFGPPCICVVIVCDQIPVTRSAASAVPHLKL